jgi:MFS family permease
MKNPHLIVLATLTGLFAGFGIGLGLDLANNQPNWLFLGMCALSGGLAGLLLSLLFRIDQRYQGLQGWFGALGGMAIFSLLFLAFTFLLVPNQSVANWRLPLLFAGLGAVPGLLVALVFAPRVPVTALAPQPTEGVYHELESSELQAQVAQLEDWVQRNWMKGFVKIEGTEYSRRIKIEIYPDNNSLDLELICSPDYPAYPPKVIARLNGRMKMFQSSVLEFWNGRATLTDVVENIVALMGFSQQYVVE